ncbi:PHO23-like protein [Mya arenaria]|uniref:PHO23-like protein n=1 Tax=Mya arenaria TaxID=6604 RepID=A0ABY7E5J0_MYAAR|nr:PHO23-like protein [Mya arenaria]
MRKKKQEVRQSKAVNSINKTSPPQNSIKEICYPSEKYVQTNATKWGCDHEKDALQKFMEEIGPLHENSRLQNSGFVISQDVSFIVASPDRIFICDYCGPACVERKDGELIKFKHNLVFQNMNSVTLLCGQQTTCMLKQTCSTLNYWTRFVPVQNILCMRQFFKNLFYTRLQTANSLPIGILHSVENTTSSQNIQPLKKCSNKQDSTVEVYCYCCQVEHGKMIGCDNEACEIEWFHCRRVSIENAPKGKLYCPDCRKLPCFKQKRLKQNRP